MLRDLIPAAAIMIYGKLSADCKVMWPKEWKNMVEKLLCMNAKDVEWITTVINQAVPSMIISVEEFRYCEEFLSDRGIDPRKVLDTKVEKGSPGFIVTAHV